METISHLGKHFLFRGLDLQQIDAEHRILERCLSRCYQSGETILSAECRTEGLCLIVSGKVRMETAHHGHEIVLRYAGEGETFGAASLFSASEHQTRVTAETDADVLIVPENLIRELIAKIPPCAENYLAFLSDRIAFLNRKIAAFTAGSAEARLAFYLLGQKMENGCFDCPVSMSSLASQLGIG